MAEKKNKNEEQKIMGNVRKYFLIRTLILKKVRTSLAHIKGLKSLKYYFPKPILTIFLSANKNKEIENTNNNILRLFKGFNPADILIKKTCKFENNRKEYRIKIFPPNDGGCSTLQIIEEENLCTFICLYESLLLVLIKI